MASFQPFESRTMNKDKNKFINAQNIYPKRLGIYKDALCLEYFNFQTDKIKKHIIPIDRSKSTQENVDEIYKNPKHSILLRKVQRKYIEGVLDGKSIMPIPHNMNHQYQQNVNPNYQQANYHSHNQGSYSNILGQQSIYSQGQSMPISNQNLNSSYQPSYAQETGQLSSIIKDPSNLSSKVQQSQEIKEIQDYYQQQFQDFQISQSQGAKGVKSQSKKQTTNEVQKVSEHSSINASQRDSTDKSVDESKEKKKKKKKKKKVEQEQDLGFDFLDDDGKEQKKQKKKKKSKDKTTSKSKDKKKQKAKQKQAEKKPSKPQPIVEQAIQQQFQFL